MNFRTFSYFEVYKIFHVWIFFKSFWFCLLHEISYFVNSNQNGWIVSSCLGFRHFHLSRTANTTTAIYPNFLFVQDLTKNSSQSLLALIHVLRSICQSIEKIIHFWFCHSYIGIRVLAEHGNDQCCIGAPGLSSFCCLSKSTYIAKLYLAVVTSPSFFVTIFAQVRNERESRLENYIFGFRK